MPVKLHYKDIGKGQQTILFLHGLGANADSWVDQEAFFKKEYRLLIPDLRGHGKTALGGEAYSFERCADDIEALLEKLNINKVHLCGFSLGGMVAFEFAVKYPERLHSFCVVNTLASFKLSTFLERVVFDIRRAAIQILPLDCIAFIMGRILFTKKDRVLRQRLIRQSKAVHRKAYLQALNAMRKWDVSQKLSAIKVRSLIMGSQYDYRIFKGKEALAKSMPNALYFEIKDAHHFVTWECADVFNRHYKNFIIS